MVAPYLVLLKAEKSRDKVTQKYTFLAGKYYIGDPCYAIANEKWDSLIDNTGCFGIEIKDKPLPNWSDGLYRYKGYTCFASGTAHGDGVYISKIGRHPVDAGLLGIIPSEAVDKKESGYPLPRLGVFHTFEQPFQVCEIDGIFYFGDILIDTR